MMCHCGNKHCSNKQSRKQMISILQIKPHLKVGLLREEDVFPNVCVTLSHSSSYE